MRAHMRAGAVRVFGSRYTTAVFSALAVVSFVTTQHNARVENRQRAAFENCITTLLDTSAHRTDVLTALQTVKDDRSDRYNAANTTFLRSLRQLTTVRTPAARQRNQLIVAIRAVSDTSEKLLQASNALNNARKANPPPPSPKIACLVRDAAIGPHPTVLLTVTPAPVTAVQTATTIRTAPAVPPVHIPGPVIFVPGPTVVRIVTVPPGHRK